MNVLKKLLHKTESSSYQSGQITIAIVVIVLIVGMFMVMQGQTTPPNNTKSVCVSRNPSKTITYTNNGVTDTYELIRENSALSKEQFGWHMYEITTYRYQGEDRILRRASTWNEAQNPGRPADYNEERDGDKIAGFPADERGRGAENLLFLDVKDPEKIQDGYIFVDIFLKKGVEIPPFIENFCRSNQPVDPLVLFPNDENKQFPPALIKADQVSMSTGTLDGETYTLFAYERMDSAVGQTHSASTERGTVVIDGRSYRVGKASFAGYLSLFSDADGYIYLYSYKLPTPTPTPPASSRNTLQLTKLDPIVVYPWGWWSPECKPAVYLYPEKETQVHVVVEPKGYLTYTDPLYPKEGWKVTARPDGTILSNNKEYPYLYYESKIKDSEIQKPQKGYVVEFNKLPQLYSDILPQLGLSEKETEDFKEYWEKVLPESKYYFVGIMEEKAIDYIEPLHISPKPQTIIRVRVYFEALNEYKSVEKPVLNAVERNGFVVSEWGGIVKLHPGTEFTCSM